MTEKPRRFIAGAVCPRCAEMDKITVEVGGEQRVCVSCGFSDARPEDKKPSASGGGELPTRVTRGTARRVETAAEVVRLVEPAGFKTPESGAPQPKLPKPDHSEPND